MPERTRKDKPDPSVFTAAIFCGHKAKRQKCKAPVQQVAQRQTLTQSKKIMATQVTVS